MVKCTIQWHFVHSRFCTTLTTNSRTFSSLQKETTYPLAVIPHFHPRPLLFSVLSGIYLESDIGYIRVARSLATFRESAELFPKVAASLPPATQESSNLSTPLPRLVVVHLFYYSYPSEHEVLSHASTFLPHTSEASSIMTTVELPNMLQGRFTHFSIVSSSFSYASISAHQFSIYLLNTHYMPIIIPGEDTVNKTNISPMPLWSLYSSGGRQTIKSLSNSG